MKQILSILLILFIVTPAFTQTKKRGKVKRKYRKIERVSNDLPAVFLRGEIYDSEKNSIAGARVTIDGTRKSVHTNEFGEFLIDNLLGGKARIRISYIGYNIKTTDYILQVGENFKKIMLIKENIHIEPVTTISQKQELQIIDVPSPITVIGAATIQQSNITDLMQLSEFVPGLFIAEQGANHTIISIRGLTNNEVSFSSQPRISTYYNNVPISRASSSSIELFDMEQIEVLKGPQNALFGRDAQAGAIHFISKKPVGKVEGHITTRIGNYAKKEFRAAVNIPVIEDKLFMRAAGVYNSRNGYVKNTFGGMLNGKNTIAGRFSIRFLPAYNHKIELVFNYQKDETPGVAFLSKMFPNTNGVTDIFNGTASLEQGKNLSTGKEFFDATLNYKYFVSEHIYWTSITSYKKSNSSARWDGDGTAAQAIDLAKHCTTEHFFQEFRGNFSVNSRINGTLGASYWRENANQTYWFSPNEQHTFYLFANPTNLVDSEGQPISISKVPVFSQLGAVAGMPLPTNHQEESISTATNQAAEIYIDASYQLTKKLFVTGGVRGVYDIYKLSNEVIFAGGSESTLGILTGNSPNLFFKPREKQSISKKILSVAGHAGLEFRLNDKTNIFTNYARGRRPNVLQFNSTGEKEIINAEILNNYDAGFKTSIFDRVYIDAVGFFQKYKNFQTGEWETNQQSGEFNYIANNNGKATSYGAETTMKIAILEQLNVFGNYAWLNATFDSTNVDGSTQKYAGNSLPLSPKHSFTFGFNGHANITPNIQLFISPSYSFKTHLYFEEANTEGLEQDAYGLLNINGGLELAEPNMILSVYGTNILDKQYITSIGNAESFFAIPTFVPGMPQLFGAKLTWKF